MNNVVTLPCVTRLDISPDRVLNGALEKGLEHAVVIGWDKDGDFYFVATYASGPKVLWLLEQAKRKLLEAGEDDS